MAKLWFLELPKHVKDMTATELRLTFPSNVDKSFLMRSIIMSEIRHGTVTYNRSLRSLWYSTVKPTLDKLGLLEADAMTEEGLTKWDATLSRYVADLLRRGYLTYRDLHILDNSRQRSNPANYYDVDNISTYGNQVTIAPYSNIIIATEKDTVYNIIKDMAHLLGCSCISSKGQNSLGAMEDLIRGMRLNTTTHHTVYILTMTDYDPAGYYIAEALEMQVRDILASMGRTWVGVEIVRVGITPDQLTDDMVEANMYSPKPSNLEKWLERTGGINGEPKGLELDALEPAQIREIFVETIRNYITTEQYSSFVKSSYIRKRALQIMSANVAKILEEVTAEYEDDIEVTAFDILELAKEGQSSIQVEDHCSNNMDEDIEAKVLSYFNM